MFCHLHCHSEYSLLDGASKVKELVARASEFGHPALAITDHGSMRGFHDLLLAAKHDGKVKPIFGVELYRR